MQLAWSQKYLRRNSTQEQTSEKFSFGKFISTTLTVQLWGKDAWPTIGYWGLTSAGNVAAQWRKHKYTHSNTQIQKYKITKIYYRILAMQLIEPLKSKLFLLLVYLLRSNIFVLIILNWRDGGQKSNIFWEKCFIKDDPLRKRVF